MDTDPGRGVWIVYWSDWSGKPVIFETELLALRYALERSMQVAFVRFGEEW